MISTELLLAYAARAMTLRVEHGLHLAPEGDESNIVPTILIVAGVAVGLGISYTFVINFIEACQMINKFPGPKEDEKIPPQTPNKVTKNQQTPPRRIFTDPDQRIVPKPNSNTKWVRLTQEEKDILMPGPQKNSSNRRDKR